MKIFSADQIYQADKSTIQKEQIKSEELMERAAAQLFEWLHSRLRGTQVSIQLFCGIGNNGGDGMALARMLNEHDYSIKVHVVNYSDKRSEDFLLNLERLKDLKVWPDFINKESDLPEISPNDIVVDAIFGIGLNRVPDDWVGKLIGHINDSRAFVLSVDVPSGLPVDRAPWNTSYVIQASYVLSFQLPKLVFFLPETGVYLNQWEVLDIGLNQDFITNTEADFELIGRPEVLPMYRPRLKFSHKGTYGHSVIVGGSYGKIGAVQLASSACLSVGSGLVSAFVPKCGYDSLQTAVPEVMVLTGSRDKNISRIEIPFEPSVVGIGVGIGQDDDTIDAFSSFLKKIKSPMVIDADGLNILSQNPEMLKDVPQLSVLTPHPKELERLIGHWDSDFEKLEKAKAFALQHNLVIVIKGAHTITIYNGKGYVNTTGNPGMATAGSGDVLTGMITGLMAQGYPPIEAAIFGVYLHGLAGDVGASKKGYEALKASILVDSIGDAYADLLRQPEMEQNEGN
ncbi:MAG TPA: bifunctional ADP-dependent NAD(P)H-hydrate dehydratase/NAD(P)H-hydrate epimerase [Muricauda sp.]|uniref:Bifunctional NAD(P)H-hydrate repair enzyme n=1 Tax=Flagellimonas aurea TaxID=2915619 RepID=A0ABS3G9Q7_9FLAO|nr:NAD(P)H-hydrate dehydratase [Allomuricauda aurea]MAO18897.1 bifunctional ADP-dependent NAD(P)H-hydrate dehydratase/NAD(P)H-hydrate epimerase [Allomuricauda sp.]MBO0356161.1 NAD(P)H-hydrate dehydratase [Allomuricauda aurea]HBU76780.1 bifunctional ADP-dependent NAD(P)H-hydrate dehydratase/NAD(P)H-hydrate epimerase [Allomuricauda sp.]